MATINLKSGVKSWAQQPKPEKTKAWSEDPDWYNKPEWRKFRKAYIDSNPLCEVSRSEKKYHAAKDLDHIIPIRYGGSKLHPDNVMGMTGYYHKRKTGLESRTDRPLVDWVETEHGLVPKRRNDILKILIR